MAWRIRHASVLAVVLIGIMAVPASAAIRFFEIRYDPPGKDSKNLNGEWVAIKNKGDKAVDIAGWYISSGKKSYTFKSGVKIGAGKVIYVYTGSGDDGRRH